MPTPTLPDDISASLELLKASVAEEGERIKSDGAKAMTNGDFDVARAVIDFAERLQDFEDSVNELMGKWEQLEDLRDAATPEVQQIVTKRFFGKRKKGEITPQDDYIPYLLEALVELGGSGKTKEVIDLVGEKMKKLLKPVDYEAHKSDSKSIRWRNSIQWARNTLVNDWGFMEKSKHGIWLISEKGREWLKNR